MNNKLWILKNSIWISEIFEEIAEKYSEEIKEYIVLNVIQYAEGVFDD